MPGIKLIDYSKTLARTKEILGIGDERPEACIVLGTGFGGLAPKDEPRRCLLSSLPGFKNLGKLEGHARELIATEIAGKLVIILNGRVHLNESLDCSSHVHVRLFSDILCAMRPKLLILTNAAGRIDPQYNVGDIMLAKHFMLLAAQTPMPLRAGEFVAADSTIDCDLVRKVNKDVAPSVGLTSHIGTYAYVRGPQFEGPADKRFLRTVGADAVGMSTAPEACVAAVHKGIKVLSISFISNTEIEEHSHQENQRRALLAEDNLVGLLTETVRIA